MTKEELQLLYKSVILPESKDPYHFEDAKKEHRDVLAYNPICGDKYALQLGADDNNPLREIYFQGMGCAVSRASTSLLLRSIEGMSPGKALSYCESFLEAVASGKGERFKGTPLGVLVEMKNFEGRMECVTLSWSAMLNFLKANQEHDS